MTTDPIHETKHLQVQINRQTEMIDTVLRSIDDLIVRAKRLEAAYEELIQMLQTMNKKRS